MSKTYDSVRARKAQKEYCKKTDTPNFAPTLGKCWSCNRNIYEQHYWIIKNGQQTEVSENNASFATGISVEEAEKWLVTGCPHCNRSYVD